MRKAEHVIVHNRHKEIKPIINGKRARRTRKAEKPRHGQNATERHKNLPNRLALEHLGHRKSKRIGQTVEKHQQDGLHKQSDKRQRKIGILQKTHNYSFNTKTNGQRDRPFQ